MREPYGYVYLIRNTVNGKVYVGQTTRTLASRWIEHRSCARNGDATIIAKAIRKHGPGAFVVVELCQAFSAEELNDTEERAVWSHGSDDREYGYNIEPGGNCGPVSAETRTKLSVAMRGRVFSAEHLARIRAARKNVSAETRLRMSESQKRRPPISDATRTKLSEARKRWTLSDASRAKLSASKRNQSAETREKISAAQRCRKHSDESRAKMSAIRKGRKLSAEHSANISRALKGKKHSDEHNAKVSAAARERSRRAAEIKLAEKIENKGYQNEQ